MHDKGLTPRAKRLCEYYVESGSAAQAGLKAGYSKSSARQTAHRIITSDAGREYIDSLMAAAHTAKVADISEVLEYLTDVMRGNVRDAFGLDPSLQERTRAAQELIKRYQAGESKTAPALDKLDSMLQDFRVAVGMDQDNVPPSSDE